MSQENVEQALRGVDAINRRDVDAFVSLLHPDVRWEVSADGFPGFSGTYRGRAEVRRWVEATLEPWDSVHVDVEEITEPSDDWLVVGTLMTTRGGGSGVETQLRIWQVFSTIDGLIATRTGPYWNREAALEAAGLSE